MKKSLKIFFILIVAIFVVWLFNEKVDAREVYNSDIEYEENSDGEIVVYSTNYQVKNVEIPSMIDGKVVTEIGEEAFFYDDKLETILLPNTIKKINSSAFHGCKSIKNINIPNSVEEIALNAFENCELLNSINIPDGVKKIEWGTFNGCTSLRYVSGLENVTNICRYAFNGCTSLEKISLPNVTNIQNNSFEKCSSLNEVILSNKLYLIEKEAFKDCTSLKKIELPQSLTYLNEGVFYNTGLTSITIPSKITDITQNLFRHCTSLENVILPSSVKWIGDSAFKGCTALENIIIANKETEIDDGENVFGDNTMITGYENSKAYYYARYYGKKFKNIETGEISQIKITPQSYFDCMPTQDVKAIGVTSVNKKDIENQSLVCIQKPVEEYSYNQLKAKVEELTKNCKTSEEKANNITNWIYSNMEYYSYINATADAYRICDIFTNLKGNDNAYTMLENYMLYLCKIPTATVEGLSNRTWSAAYIDGEWVYIDAVNGKYNVTDLKPYSINYAYAGKLYILEDPSKGAKAIKEIKEIPFADVEINGWEYTAVRYMWQNEYMTKGNTSALFSPNDLLTRAMLVTILHNMEGRPYVPGTSKFTDVQNSNEWYYVAIKWAAKNNIVSGYSNGNFGPNDPITREQLAVILNQYCKYKGKYKTAKADYSKFSDSNKISDFAKWGMNWAVGTGVINGANGKLNPKGTATRAETASMIYKYCIKIE